jgi:hypothetical protein
MKQRVLRNVRFGRNIRKGQVSKTAKGIYTSTTVSEFLSAVFNPTISGGDKAGVKPVRTRHRRQYQFLSFVSKNGSEFAENGSEFGEFGSEFHQNGSEFIQNWCGLNVHAGSAFLKLPIAGFS